MKRILPLLRAIAATLHAADEVKIEKGVASVRLTGWRRRISICRLLEGKKHPGILIIHGGGWTEKRDAAREINIGTTCAGHGYVCMSIDYLLHDAKSDKPCWPQNLHDCKTAVRWMRANAERLHLDAEHIGVIGRSSAGGRLSGDGGRDGA